MATFKYPKLYEGNKSFRLIRLYKGPRGERGAQLPRIECDFELAYLDGGREYDAVSYVWGKNTGTYTIYVAGKALKVSEVLFDMLVRLRELAQDRLLWIDQLCIDQDNAAEKSRQVERMREIFGQAQCVIASIGLHFHHAWMWGSDASITNITARSDSINLSEVEALVRSENVPLTVPQEATLLTFFQKPWFQRIWVIQEASVAKRLRMVAGTTEMDGTILSRLHSSIPLRSQNSGLKARLEVLAPFLQLITGCSDSEKRSDLVPLIYSFRQWKATDPRDKVYALLGLSCDENEENLLTPDYSLAVETVYVRLAHHALNRYQSLEILTYCLSESGNPDIGRISWGTSAFRFLSSKSKQTGLPTWCPDWRLEQSLVNPPASVMEKKRGDVYSLIYSLSRSNALCVMGVSIGSVESVYSSGIDVRVRNSGKMDIPGRFLTTLSARLETLSSGLFESNGGTIVAGDEICILQSSTGMAVLRPHKAAFTLVVLDHSQFWKIGRVSERQKDGFIGGSGLTVLGAGFMDLYEGGYYKSEDNSLDWVEKRQKRKRKDWPLRLYEIV